MTEFDYLYDICFVAQGMEHVLARAWQCERWLAEAPPDYAPRIAEIWDGWRGVLRSLEQVLDTLAQHRAAFADEFRQQAGRERGGSRPRDRSAVRYECPVHGDVPEAATVDCGPEYGRECLRDYGQCGERVTVAREVPDDGG